MLIRWTGRWSGYALAVVVTALAVLLRLALDPWLRDTSAYIVFYFSIALAAIVGGFGPGLIALLVGTAAATVLFIPPRGSLGIALREDQALLGLFLLTGGLMVLLGGWAHRSRRRYRILAEHTHDWEFWLSPEGRFLYCSPSCLAMTGYPAASFEANPELLDQLVHPEDRALYAAHQGSGVKGCATKEVEFRIIRRDGTVRWIGHACETVYDDGRYLGVRGSNRDVTERKVAEAALRASEERFRAFFDLAAVGAVEVEPVNGRFLRVNDRYCRITGYDREELLGMTVTDLIHPEEREACRAQFEEFVSGRPGELITEKRYLRKDGETIWAYLSASMLRDAAGAPIRAVGIVEDITARKHAEQELERASAAKDRFLATLSHELRTPLTPVLATIELLTAEPGLDSETREELEVIRRNVELEARLIDDLLDLTRIARGKVELVKRPVRLCDVIMPAVEVCQPDIEARRLHFAMDIERGAPFWVEADPGRLQQVFWNLIKNAVKFTPHGGCVSIRCGRDDQGHAVMEIRDSGVGIEPEALSRIFNAFEQASGSITREFGGLGLGLAISKALVELHGGVIEAHSEGKDTGSTFRVRLPLLKSDERRVMSDESRPHSSLITHDSSLLRPLRVLLVEDHGDTARIMTRLLRRRGHDVQTAGDVATGLELAGRERFDLLISDLGLPDRSGLELMRELRARGQAMPSIALSGYGQEEDITRSHEAGFAAHLTKPVDFEQFDRTIALVTR